MFLIQDLLTTEYVKDFNSDSDNLSINFGELEEAFEFTDEDEYGDSFKEFINTKKNLGFYGIFTKIEII